MYHLTFLKAAYERSSCSTFNLIFGMVNPFNFSYCNRCITFIHCSFNLYLPNGQWYWESFHVFIHHSYIFFVEVFIQILCIFLLDTWLSYYIELHGFSIYSGYKSFSGYMFCQYFLPACGLLFHFFKSTKWICR